LPASGTTFSMVKSGREAAVFTSYSPALTGHTWRPKQPIAPWKMTELWLFTDRGMIGLITSTAAGEQQARELCHQFRFISKRPVEERDRLWRCGEILFAVWDTSFSFTIEEKMRRFAQGINDRRDWQFALSDTDRSPENDAQNPQPKLGEDPNVDLKLPELRLFQKGYSRYSLVEISPIGERFEKVERLSIPGLVGFRVTSEKGDRLVIANPSEEKTKYELEKGERVATIPAGGVILVE
ncbi:MAG: hypothetical protein QF886_26160, partial [Planctomycetota bacterium]|nr:hypothetical protein [Planctomycetota bacterium]